MQKEIIEHIIEEISWKPIDVDGNNIYELQRGETRITIEEDGRPELSGSPQENLHNLSREFRLHNNELREMGNIFNIAWLPTGFRPLHANSDIQKIRQKRYEIMEMVEDSESWQSHLKRTNGITVNFSVTDEENAIRKTQTFFR